MNLKPPLSETLDELGYHTLTPIQQKSVPLVIEGKDVLAQAKTGSGKTAAFGLGLLHNIDLEELKIQSLIVCPTRELCEQVAGEIRKLGRKLPNLKVQTVTGGNSENNQKKSLDYGSHIIIGTPGRLVKFLKTKILDLSTLKSFVLDEADRMLDMGFIDSIQDIVSYIPKDAQCLLFSATFPEDILELSKNLQQDPTQIKVDEALSTDVIEEYFYGVESHKEKNQALLNILAYFKPQRALIFCKTKVLCSEIVDSLAENQILAKAIHGDIKQNQRQAVLDQFAGEGLNLMVATDVAARGLDIKDLPFVINYDLTNEAEVYIHRKGRTARAGRKGVVINFVKIGNEYKLENIERLTGQTYELFEIPQQQNDQKYDLLPKFKTYFISGGKKNKLRPGDIVGALVNELGINGDEIGKINIHPVFSYVAIKYEVPIKESFLIIKKKKFRLGLV